MSLLNIRRYDIGICQFPLFVCEIYFNIFQCTTFRFRQIQIHSDKTSHEKWNGIKNINSSKPANELHKLITRGHQWIRKRWQCPAMTSTSQSCNTILCQGMPKSNSSKQQYQLLVPVICEPINIFFPPIFFRNKKNHSWITYLNGNSSHSMRFGVHVAKLVANCMI